MAQGWCHRCDYGGGGGVFCLIRHIMGDGNWSLSKQDTLVLKGLAIIAMLLHHLYCSIPDWIQPYNGVLAWLGSLGKVCVAIFLFCSGYGLSAQFDKVQGMKNSCKYMVKRFISFYFNYWVVFIIFVPVTVFLFHRPLSAAYGENFNIIKSLGYDLLGIQGFRSYNITWWFNKLFLILYLLFPIIYIGVRHFGVLVLLLSILICRFWMTFVGFDFYGDLYNFQLPFVLGVLWNKWAKMDGICRLRMNGHLEGFFRFMQGKLYIILALASLFLIVVILFRMYPIIPHWTSLRMDAFVTMGVAMFIVSLRSLGVPMRALAFLGKHSANIFLIHTFYNVYWHFSWLHNGAVMRSGLNFIVLLLMCLISSIALEWMKERMGVNKMLNLIKIRLS